MNFLRLRIYKILTLINMACIVVIVGLAIGRMNTENTATRLWLLITALPFIIFVIYYAILLIITTRVVNKELRKKENEEQTNKEV